MLAHRLLFMLPTLYLLMALTGLRAAPLPAEPALQMESLTWHRDSERRQRKPQPLAWGRQVSLVRGASKFPYRQETCHLDNAATPHVWRRTHQGWQQIPMDPVPVFHALDLPHERPRIHPLSVASLTLLLTLATMAWASTEWDWQRFVGES